MYTISYGDNKTLDLEKALSNSTLYHTNYYNESVININKYRILNLDYAKMKQKSLNVESKKQYCSSAVKMLKIFL